MIELIKRGDGKYAVRHRRPEIREDYYRRIWPKSQWNYWMQEQYVAGDEQNVWVAKAEAEAEFERLTEFEVIKSKP